MKKLSFVATLTLLLNLLLAVPAYAADCTKDLSRRLPIILVHGFNGSPGSWEEGETPMRVKLCELSQQIMVQEFNYKLNHFNWVDQEDIGPRLAKEITRLATASRKAGGPGKVVIVAHSMGGLAVRYAASQGKTANDIGLVVTLGTPNTGTIVANWATIVLSSLCTAAVLPIPNLVRPPGDSRQCLDAVAAMQIDSRKLQSLPGIPKSIPVLAIAGNIIDLSSNFFSATLKPTDSDSVVSVSSALQGANTLPQGGGKKIIECVGESVVSLPLFPNAPCEHGKLTQNKVAQSTIAGAIKKYLTWLKTQSACLSKVSFETTVNQALAKNYHGEDFLGFTIASDVTCQDGWAAAAGTLNYFGGRTQGVAYALHYVNGRWLLPPGQTDELCGKVPPKVKAALFC